MKYHRLNQSQRMTRSELTKEILAGIVIFVLLAACIAMFMVAAGL